MTELKSIAPGRLQRSPDAPSYVVRRSA
jgi:hypothetical protein